MSAHKLNIEALKERPVKVLSYYDILENDDGEIMFAMKYFNSPRIEGHNPTMYYDGGQHSILLKNDKLVVICDFIHPGVRKILSGVKTVLCAELVSAMLSEGQEENNDNILEEYEAELEFYEGIEGIAEELMELNKNKAEELEKQFDKDITAKVKGILTDRFGVYEGKIMFNSELQADLDIDYIEMIELTMAVEKEFKILIPNEDFKKWHILGDIVEYLTKRQG
jgi:acyl carrier protein